MKNSMLLAILLIAVINFKIGSAQEPFVWEYLDAPYTGRVETMQVNSKDHIFIGTRNGVFRSTDHGENWFHVYLGGKIISIAIDSNDNIFIIDDNRYLRDTSSILFSNDDGDSWSIIYNPDNTDRFIDPKKLAFNSEGNLYMLSFYFGIEGEKDKYLIHYSTDLGKNWNKCETVTLKRYPFTDKRYYLLDFEVNDSGHIAAYGYTSDRGYTGVVFISTDNGKSWEEIDTNTGYDTEGVSCIKYISDSVCYAGMWSGLYLSKNNCKNWQLVGLFGTAVFEIYFISDDEFYLATNRGIYYTTDAGNTFELKSNGFESLMYKSIGRIKGDSKGILYATPYWEGVYRSTDNGGTWHQSNNGFVGAIVDDITIDKEGNIYAGTYGLFRSSDNGATWKLLGFEGIGIGAIIINEQGHIFIGDGHYGAGVFRSTDNCKTWENFTEGLGATGGSVLVKDFLINKDKMFLGSVFGSIDMSTDNGETWYSKELESGSLGLSINYEGHIFACGDCERIARSTDNGETWEVVRKQQHGEVWELSAIKLHPHKPIGYATGRGGLHKTTDNGRTWFSPKNEIKTYKIEYSESLAVDSAGNFYIGLYRSTDLGERWEKLDSGLRNKRIATAIAVSPDGYIFAALEYGGMYRSREPVVSVKETTEHANGIILKQNQPNPFEEHTEISYYLDEPAFVRIKLYNLLGIEVAGYANEFMPGGWHTLIVNGSGLADGVYILRFESAGKAATKTIHKVK